MLILDEARPKELEKKKKKTAYSTEVRKLW
jgi:hypothetical protein